MRLILIRAMTMAAASAIAWLLAGRQISLLADRIMTIPLESLPVSPLAYEGGSLRIGDRALDGNIHVDGDRVVLSAGGQSFTLGAFDNPLRQSGGFTCDPGDRISFTLDRGYLSWPTPFEFNFMTGRSPSWKRHRYYRLVWKKRTGARLEMLWRYEQWFYSSDGWTGGDMIREGATGLIRTGIRAQTTPHESAAVEYISETKGWKPGEYRVENRGLSADGQSDVLAVIHIEDERGSQPGAGRSVELYVDHASGRVTKELGGQ